MMLACIQVLQHADTAFYMGMIDMSQRIQVSIMQLRAAQLIFEGSLQCTRIHPLSAATTFSANFSVKLLVSRNSFQHGLTSINSCPSQWPLGTE